ncbi:MAG: coproporphyrinogen dehydrogenase HemZ [Mogibacterium sp.]|nr:coproporphyrinogen dehydrogenase HemZ [Mogibacterium sp.]
MYRFYLNQVSNEYHFAELVREFLPEESFEAVPGSWIDAENYKLTDNSYMINPLGEKDRDEIKAELYRLLSDLTGRTPPWGTLTGVRPLKLAFLIYDRYGSVTDMVRVLQEAYLLQPDKAALMERILRYQLRSVSAPGPDRYSIYVGIPFCPTRCSYCSFASSVASGEVIDRYLEHLLREIRYTGSLLRDSGKSIESLYIGGGTPTTLAAHQLEPLLNVLYDAFRLDPEATEVTVEAGRPDTITQDKLNAIRACGVDRISINPQSMKAETLRLIGRDHRPEDIVKAFELAAQTGFRTINSDLIAGLPEESPEDFGDTLRKILSLGAGNITVHTLSVKRGSRLREEDPAYYRRDAETVSAMLGEAGSALSSSGFEPYYIYRQKHQIGSFENVGYCRDGLHSLYNIRIMEEKQSIVGLGAGAIGKIWYPAEDRLERVANISNVQVYFDRFEEILARKDKYLEMIK